MEVVAVVEWMHHQLDHEDLCIYVQGTVELHVQEGLLSDNLGPAPHTTTLHGHEFVDKRFPPRCRAL